MANLNQRLSAQLKSQLIVPTLPARTLSPIANPPRALRAPVPSSPQVVSKIGDKKQYLSAHQDTPSTAPGGTDYKSLDIFGKW
ncbi:MAG: hypothetical protein Q9178_007264 [Gyalolechia marmorata]